MPPYLALLNLAKTLISTLLCWRLPVWDMIYPDEPEEPPVKFIGRTKNLSLFTLPGEGSVPELRPCGQTSLLKLKRTIQQLARDHSLIVEIPHRVGRFFLAGNGILVVPNIKWRIKIDRPWEEIIQGFKQGDLQQSSIKRDLRGLRNSGIELTHTHDAAMLEHFYTEMYVPYMTHRFEDLKGLTRFETMRVIFKKGWLTLYSVEGQVLGGAVQYFAGKMFVCDSIGFAQGNTPHQNSLVSTASYYHNIRQAWELGCQYIDLTMTNPLLEDGVVRYKRKWGGEVINDPRQNWGLWLYPRLEPGKKPPIIMRQPWIWLDERKRLNGLRVVQVRETPLSQLELDELCQAVWIPGLYSIAVYSLAGFTPEVPQETGPLSALGTAAVWKPNGHHP